MTVCQTFLVCEILTVLRSAAQVFCKMSLRLGLPDVFPPGEIGVTGSGEEDHSDRSVFSSHIKDICYQHGLSR